jgi:stringent starvation protein B
MGDDAPGMSSHRPYVLRALYEWIVDNGMTPHVLVDARMPGVRVPAHAVKDGRIVLNIAERAVAKLELGNDALRFTARFAGVSQSVMVPLPAVIAVYARETGQGMALPDEPRGGATPMEPAGDSTPDTDLPPPEDDGPGGPPGPAEPPKRGGHLRIVK